MDWQIAITRNCDALSAIIVALIASLGLPCGGRLTVLPRFLYRKALRILRPAEAALRRLIVMAAHEMALRGVGPRSPRGVATDFSRLPPRAMDRLPAFNLIDPLKNFEREAPNFNAFNTAFDDEPTSRMPMPAAALGLRLLSLKHALDTIPQQAKRLARWYAARDLANKQNRPHRQSPMRPGPPPASQKATRTEVDAVLRECHFMAIYARERPDSS